MNKQSHGWIKLYRCLLDDPLWQCGTNEQKIILITLLLMANHAEAKWQWQGRPYRCKPGQMITSLASIQEKCGKHISPYNIRTALKRFETFGFLTNHSTNQNRLITICNWERYQSMPDPIDRQAHTQATNDPHPTHRQPTPNKNVKNEKKEKNLSLREEVSSKDFNKNTADDERLLQETLRIAKEYNDEQKRICQMLQRTNP